MTDREIISLREFFEARLTAMEAIHKKDVELFREYIRSTDEARQLQAIEYERRLAGLNGEQERIARSQATYVSREVWDRFQAEYNDWKQSYEVRHAEVVTRREIDQRKNEIDTRMETMRKDIDLTMEILRKDFLSNKEETRTALATFAGQSKGVTQMWAVIMGLVMAAIGAAAIYFKR
jgi:hypothetical protein